MLQDQWKPTLLPLLLLCHQLQSLTGYSKTKNKSLEKSKPVRHSKKTAKQTTPPWLLKTSGEFAKMKCREWTSTLCKSSYQENPPPNPVLETEVTLSWGARHWAAIWELFLTNAPVRVEAVSHDTEEEIPLRTNKQQVHLLPGQVYGNHRSSQAVGVGTKKQKEKRQVL